MNKVLPAILFGLVLLIAGYLLFALGYVGGAQEAREGEGTIFIGFTDAAADMQAVSEVYARIDEVYVYSEAQGWTRVSSDDTEYELLKLRDANSIEYYGEVVVPEGDYSKVRVVFDEVNVEKTDGSIHTAALVTSTVEIDAQTRVESQKYSHVTIDVLADKSLYTAADGSYVFAPAITVESRSNTDVSVDASTNVVTLTGGNVDTLVTIGTDVDGSVKTNFELPSTTEFEVSLLGEVNVSESSTTEGSTTGGDSGSDSVDINGSIQTETGVNLR